MAFPLKNPIQLQLLLNFVSDYQVYTFKCKVLVIHVLQYTKIIQNRQHFKKKLSIMYVLLTKEVIQLIVLSASTRGVDEWRVESGDTI